MHYERHTLVFWCCSIPLFVCLCCPLLQCLTISNLNLILNFYGEEEKKWGSGVGCCKWCNVGGPAGPGHWTVIWNSVALHWRCTALPWHCVCGVRLYLSCGLLLPFWLYIERIDGPSIITQPQTQTRTTRYCGGWGKQ